MKFVFPVLVGILAAVPAMAAVDQPAQNGRGHWAWIADPFIGPKSGMPTHHHIWVPDQPSEAAPNGPGHWQWIHEISVGPRAGAPISRRVWVND